MNETENLVLQENTGAEENVQVEPQQQEQLRIEEQPAKPAQKMYTQDEVDTMMSKRVARLEQKHSQQVESEYGELMGVLRAGTGMQSTADITASLKNYYQGKGRTIPEKPAYSEKETRILAQAEVREIIDSGMEEVAEEISRLAKLGAGMSPKEKVMFRELTEYQANEKRNAELVKLGIPKEVYESAEFKGFAGKFNSQTPMGEIYGYYAQTQKPAAQAEVETMGSVQNIPTDSKGVKDYYTPEDVDRLTAADFKNPTVMERVRESMLKWKT